MPIAPSEIDMGEQEEIIGVQNRKKGVRYINIDVLTESKNRIRHIIDKFDHLFVCFSGGKDSLVVLNLVREVYDELGMEDKKVDVIFRDEELIPDDVINFVNEYRLNPRFDLRWFAVQIEAEKFILGKTLKFIQWDSTRKWIRPKPEWAITDPLDRKYTQYTMDELMSRGYKGKIAFVNGIRADESLVRFKSCTNKVVENYICGTEARNVSMVKPIYDWSQNDVFRYFYDRKIKYCPIYDLQTWNSQNLRVSTPLHAESSKRFGKLRTLYPIFYEQLIEMFPEMTMQERYWDSYDRYSIIYKYPKSWNGILQYIRETIPDVQLRGKAIHRVLDAKQSRENAIAKGDPRGNWGGYPLLYVFKVIMAGQFKRPIMPKKTPDKEDLEYESLIAA